MNAKASVAVNGDPGANTVQDLKDQIDTLRGILYRVAAADERHKREVGYPMLQPSVRYEIRELFPNCTFPGFDHS